MHAFFLFSLKTEKEKITLLNLYILSINPLSNLFESISIAAMFISKLNKILYTLTCKLAMTQLPDSKQKGRGVRTISTYEWFLRICLA